MAENPGAVTSFGQDPAELDGVHVDVLAAGFGSELPSGRPTEREGERLTVRARPLDNDVGHDPGVVVGIDVEWLGRCPSQVDAVHPHVTGEADVEEVGERLSADRSREVEQGKPADGTREPGAGC